MLGTRNRESGELGNRCHRGVGQCGIVIANSQDQRRSDSGLIWGHYRAAAGHLPKWTDAQSWTMYLVDGTGLYRYSVCRSHHKLCLCSCLPVCVLTSHMDFSEIRIHYSASPSPIIISQRPHSPSQTPSYFIRSHPHHRSLCPVSVHAYYTVSAYQVPECCTLVLKMSEAVNRPVLFYLLDSVEIYIDRFR